MTTSRRPAIIKLGSTVPSLPTHRGDFEEWILAGMAMRRENVIIVDPRRARDSTPVHAAHRSAGG